MAQRVYIIIWAVLVALVGVSIALGKVLGAQAAVIAIFIIAAFKAYMVASYYMHLKTEARWVKVALWTGVACLLILFWALVPDIIKVYGRIA